MIDILFTSRRNIVSRWIRQHTWSDWSHVGLHMNGSVVEATMMHGVRVVPFEQAVAGTDHHILAPVPCANEGLVWGMATSQVGKRYDWLSILGIAFKREWQKDDAWICHELVAWAFEKAGFPLLQASHLNRLSPQHLLLSPYVKWR